MRALISGTALILFSILSQAASFSSIEQEQYTQDHEIAVARYAQASGKSMPEIQDYRYGMKLDVAKLVRQSQDPKSCSVYPRLMTFEDSQGQLETIRYSMLSQCINNK